MSTRKLKRANPSTIHDKFLVGYQGWFTCAGDGEPVGPGHHGWLHWFNHPIPDGGRPNTDLWPDVSSYSPSELFPAPGLTMQDGSQAFLFSSRHPKTVQKHFRWMAEHGVDGAFLQRFAGQCDLESGNHGVRRIRDEVGDVVMKAAEQEGRVFSIMYDVSGVAPDRIQRVLESDWQHLIRNKGILDSPNYLREKGQPVLALWGFGFEDSRHTPRLLHDIIQSLRRLTPGGLYIMAGTPAYWRTADHDADRDGGFLKVWLNEVDAISPWTIGRYSTEDEVEQFAERRMKGDADLLRQQADSGGRKVDYIPVVLPGGSGFNLSEGKWKFNDIKRNGGRFLWKQIFHAKRLGVRTIYGAMWDEYDEGTAFMPCVTTKHGLPQSDKFNFLALNADGYDLPSDWYMRICGFAAEGLRSDRLIHETFPSKELDDYWSSRPRYEVEDDREEGGSGSGSGSGADDRYEVWLKTQKEDKDELPPPPYSLEAEEAEARAQTVAQVQPSTSTSHSSSAPPRGRTPPTNVSAPATVVQTPPASTIGRVSSIGAFSPGPSTLPVSSSEAAPPSPASSSNYNMATAQSSLFSAGPATLPPSPALNVFPSTGYSSYNPGSANLPPPHRNDSSSFNGSRPVPSSSYNGGPTATSSSTYNNGPQLTHSSSYNARPTQAPHHGPMNDLAHDFGRTNISNGPPPIHIQQRPPTAPPMHASSFTPGFVQSPSRPSFPPASSMLPPPPSHPSLPKRPSATNLNVHSSRPGNSSSRPPPPRPTNSRPSTAEYGSRPSTAEYGSRPSNPDYGNRLSNPDFGNRPPAAEYGNRPPTAEYGRRPSTNNYGVRPPSRPPTAEYNSRPLADYGRMVASPHSPHFPQHIPAMPNPSTTPSPQWPPPEWGSAPPPQPAYAPYKRPSPGPEPFGGMPMPGPRPSNGTPPSFPSSGVEVGGVFPSASTGGYNPAYVSSSSSYPGSGSGSSYPGQGQSHGYQGQPSYFPPSQPDYSHNQGQGQDHSSYPGMQQQAGAGDAGGFYNPSSATRTGGSSYVNTATNALGSVVGAVAGAKTRDQFMNAGTKLMGRFSK